MREKGREYSSWGGHPADGGSPPSCLSGWAATPPPGRDPGHPLRRTGGTTPAHVLWSSAPPRVGWVCWRLGAGHGMASTDRVPNPLPDLTCGLHLGAAWAIVLGAGTSIQTMGAPLSAGSLVPAAGAGLGPVGRYGSALEPKCSGRVITLGSGCGSDGTQTIADPRES